MFSKLRGKNGENGESKVVQIVSGNKENPKITLEFLPNDKVMPIVSWEPHSNVNIKLMAEVFNLLNEGKLYEAFRGAVIQQGVVSGDVELAAALHNSIKDPKSIEDEEPLIHAGAVTRLHFSQQINQEGDE